MKLPFTGTTWRLLRYCFPDLFLSLKVIVKSKSVFQHHDYFKQNITAGDIFNGIYVIIT